MRQAIGRTTAALALLGLWLAAGAGPTTAQVVRPAVGSPERAAILDAVRPVVADLVGPPVELVVDDLRVVGDRAFVAVAPQRPGGGAIDLSRLAGAEEMDGLHTEAILERSDGRWRVVRHGVGSTDVWYLEFCAAYPAGLIPGC